VIVLSRLTMCTIAGCLLTLVAGAGRCVAVGVVVVDFVGAAASAIPATAVRPASDSVVTSMIFRIESSRITLTPRRDRLSTRRPRAAGRVVGRAVCPYTYRPEGP
jgi:hypothetical protein